MVEYNPADLMKEVEHHLVLVAQDEMTAQANDGQKFGWYEKGEQPLKKKGAG